MTNPPTKIKRPGYWQTLSEYERDEEFLRVSTEEFYPTAKPDRYFEKEGDQNAFLTPIKRRTFLKLSGFAAIAAMLQGCERPETPIHSFVNKPEEITLGQPNYYTSTLGEGEGLGLIVKTREGRPIKLEGNPDSPVNRGGLSAKSQASIIDLYSPDRIRFPMRPMRRFNMDLEKVVADADRDNIVKIDKEIGDAIKNATGEVVLLTPTINGPSNDRLIEKLTSAGGKFRHVMYDPLAGNNERRAYELAFGEAVTPRYCFEKAAVVVAIGGDPIGQGSSTTEFQRTFASRRRPEAEAGMSRVFSFQSSPTMAGTQSDYHYTVRPESFVKIGLAIANLLINEHHVPNAAGGGELTRLAGDYTPARAAADTGVPAEEIAKVAKWLADHPRESIVYTEGSNGATENGLSLSLVGILLNYLLGNYENTIDVTASPSMQVRGNMGQMFDLTRRMRAGTVEVLLIAGVNPVYTLPDSAEFREALSNVKTIVSLGMWMDETTALSDIVVPGVHELESWGDSNPQKDVYGIRQPAIRRIYGELAKDPTYHTRPWQESVMRFMDAAGTSLFKRPATQVEVDKFVADAGTTDTMTMAKAQAPRPASWYDFVRQTWSETVYRQGNFPAKFDSFWTSVLQKGVVDLVGDEKRAGSFAAPRMNMAALGNVKAGAQAAGRVLVAYPSLIHGDGTSMLNPYLLEIPDPFSKVCWDNYASISPATAKELRVSDGDFVELKANGKSVKLPAFIQPGVHKDVVTVMLGWGRKSFGAIGDGLGSNIYPLLGTTDAGVIFSGIPVEITRAGGSTRLANVMGHNYMHSPERIGLMVNERHDAPADAEKNEQGVPVYDRPIVAEATLAEWEESHDYAYPNHTPRGYTDEHPDGEKPESMWLNTHKYDGHHWGLSVDLSACNGCNACIIACQVENNVPVVGKEEVIVGREMHWIRLDRYYRGDREDPEFATMPVMCQHCDHAPCETVCPVIATMHNDEGLNVMAYNRCVGTRYCANNCPYKVRRFNFWDYSKFRTGPHDERQRVSPLELVLNPEVTTRTRGVMEKCTFCIERIRAAKNVARESGEPMKDGTMKTACQQTCPAQAISFGDANDPDSDVLKQFKNERAYGLLVDLNTDPSVRYLALIKNRDEPSPYRTMYQEHRLHEEEEEKAGRGGEGERPESGKGREEKG